MSDRPGGVFLGTENVMEDMNADARDNLAEENERLKMRVEALTHVLADYALRLSTLRVQMQEMELRISGNGNG